jgi:hypothetical protein
LKKEVKRIMLTKAKEFENTQEFEKAAQIYEELDMWHEAGEIREQARIASRTVAPMAIPKNI